MTVAAMHFVLIETSGNQKYIFATNKLRENFGASELTHLSGTQWVLEAVHSVGGPALWNQDGAQLRKNLLNPKLNSPIEAGASVEVIVATSGKALLLVRNEEDARRIVRRVTRKALREGPGLDICGVIEPFDWNQNTLGNVNQRVHQQFEAVHSSLQGPQMRFLRLPVVEECATSGLPANVQRPFQEPEEPQPLSLISAFKGNAGEKAFERIEALLKREGHSIHLPRNLDELEKKFESLSWLAVVHADGNGLGEIFLRFQEHISAQSPKENRRYVEKLRRFSLALDICTEQAFLKAIDTLAGDIGDLVPLVPLVLGGDDLTVICDGQQAIGFTHAFLKAFEEQSARLDILDGIIPEISKVAFEASHLSACAGVAIVKHHFPFSVAYELSEDLMQSAKQVKRIVVAQDNPQMPRPCSALDFHVLYDASGVALKQIRQRQQVDGQQTLLYGRPYVITPIESLEGSSGLDWVACHRWEDLVKLVAALTAKEDGTEYRKLPNSQMHQLRSGLFLGQNEADARLRLIYNRYACQGLKHFNQATQEEPSLFRTEPNTNKQITSLLDALDLVNFYTAKE
jgi:hypothetical protein